jgi:hypothetical protein
MTGQNLKDSIINGSETMEMTLVFLIALVAGLGTLIQLIDKNIFPYLIKQFSNSIKTRLPKITVVISSNEYYSLGDFFCSKTKQLSIPNEKKSTY